MLRLPRDVPALCRGPAGWARVPQLRPRGVRVIPFEVWSWILTAVGVFGLWLAGRKDRRGWMVGVAAQGLWIAYATATEQWGFYVSALAYGWVYVRNARAWSPVKSEAPSCWCGWCGEPLTHDNEEHDCWTEDDR